MKRIRLLVLFGLLCWGVNAQNTDSSVVFTAKFLKNEYQRYDVSKTIYTLNRKDTTDLLRVGFKAEVVVTDSLENAYILRWKISSYTINTNDSYLQKMMALAVPVTISYRISKPGVFEEFISGTAATNCLEAALPIVLRSLKGLSDSTSKAEASKIYALRENVETLILGFMIQFHQFHGLGYTLGEVVDVPVEINSRFTSKPLPGIQHKKLTTIDTNDQTAVMVYATELDMNGYRQALSENLKMGLDKVKSFQQNNIGSFMMDLRTGWPLWSMDQRESIAGLETYGEQLEIQYK
ncbi:MAG TPA: hypothetical protein VFP20_11450 [Bacteroidales bacterium]|nr:hypothetical protein [Bacteroidales bacterium]